MRVLHTSDWHLGKKFYSKNLIEEQKFFLDWLINQITIEEIDLLIISGDIFDVPHPPTNAIALFYEFLSEIEKVKDLKTVIIPGNHDSSKFISSINPLIENSNIHLACEINDIKNKLIFEKENQKVNITTLPYFKWSDLINFKNEHNINAESDLNLIEKIFETTCTNTNDESFNILVAHHLFGSFQDAGSEQGLHLSGISTIPLSSVRPYFDLITLGHIHRAQVLKKEGPLAVYSGAPMPFRFNECFDKFVSKYEIKDNKCNYQFIKIPQFREFMSINTNKENWNTDLKQYLSTLSDITNNAYLEVVLNLDAPDVLITDEIKNYLIDTPIELINLKTIFNNSSYVDEQESILVDNLSTENLFDLYYAKKYGSDKEIPQAIRQEFISLLTECRNSIPSGTYQ